MDAPPGVEASELNAGHARDHRVQLLGKQSRYTAPYVNQAFSSSKAMTAFRTANAWAGRGFQLWAAARMVFVQGAGECSTSGGPGSGQLGSPRGIRWGLGCDFLARN